MVKKVITKDKKMSNNAGSCQIVKFKPLIQIPEDLQSFAENFFEVVANDYTDEGNLMGHIVIGAMMIRDKIKAIRERGESFPETLEQELIHCILAHHGELEFGSPKKPALIEAVALSMADNLDAKLESFTETLKDAGDNSDWLGFNRQFDANIRKTLS